MTENKPILYMNIGLPASGKSTYCSKLENAVKVSGDSMREELFGDEGIQFTEEFLQENGIDTEEMSYDLKQSSAAGIIWAMVSDRAEELLRQGTNVIYDGTNVKKSYRDRIIRRFSPLAYIHGIVFDVDAQTCIERDGLRGRHVGKEVIEKFVRQFTFPTMEEGFDELTVIDKDGNETAHYTREDRESGVNG